MSDVFELGEDVIVNGELLTIKSIDGDTAICIWYDKKKGSWEEKEFPINMLSKYTVAVMR